MFFFSSSDLGLIPKYRFVNTLQNTFGFMEEEKDLDMYRDTVFIAGGY